jgi:hypothetical protein
MISLKSDGINVKKIPSSNVDIHTRLSCPFVDGGNFHKPKPSSLDSVSISLDESIITKRVLIVNFKTLGVGG